MATESNNDDEPKHEPPADLSKANPEKPALVSGKDKKKKKPHPDTIQWDEEKIKEHDQLRGTRMKIDEPNTPYHYDSGSETDGSHGSHPHKHVKVGNVQVLNLDHLSNKLGAVEAVREAYPSDASSHGSTKEEEMRKLEFKEHRKRHYNEFEAIKQWRAAHPDGDDEDEDADDEGN